MENTKRLEALLKEGLDKLIGEKVDYSSIYSTMNKAVNSWCDELNLDKTLFSIQQSRNYQVFYIEYKRNSVGRVEYKRERGTYHYYCFGEGSYDYTYKSFNISWYNYYCDKDKDILEKMKEIDEEIEQKKQRDNDKLNQAKAIYNLIKKEINAKDDSEVRDFIYYLNDNKYRLEDK